MKFALVFLGLASAINVRNGQRTLLDPSSEWYQAADDGVTPLGGDMYIRTIPDQYGEENTDNKFMKAIYQKFAMEKKDDKGKGTGLFKMDKNHTKEVARDVAIKEKKLSGKELDEFVN